MKRILTKLDKLGLTERGIDENGKKYYPALILDGRRLKNTIKNPSPNVSPYNSDEENEVEEDDDVDSLDSDKTGPVDTDMILGERTQRYHDNADDVVDDDELIDDDDDDDEPIEDEDELIDEDDSDDDELIGELIVE